ncbi:gamma-glutamyl kinase [Aquicoccus sp. G2-2]|uniref:gamma-glutamyl kinase n=1 Tax=Aquicoccus sp. G2-2 TaxID=3092120 RepID=UPI002AE02709|nr:gamma-glutamyl kinase [Aquicoccus sp. G2-2]MEA1113388.1 gamma-glutamyl kinase [Aquicoccus sp. G2-2]
MLIFSKAKLVVLSVPKTGTTALEAVLGPKAAIAISQPPELKHAPIYRYNRFFRPMVEKFIGKDVDVVAVIREPVSWLGSWYRYRQRPFLDGRVQSTSGLSFPEFVEGYLAEPRKAFANVGAQSKFIESRPNGTAVTRLFRYEAFGSFLAFLEARLETEIDLPRVNVSGPADLALPASLETRLRETCAEDFALWETLTDDRYPA